jgi:hypothetical protein
MIDEAGACVKPIEKEPAILGEGYPFIEKSRISPTFAYLIVA